MEDSWVITVIDRTNVERAMEPVIEIIRKQEMELDRIVALSNVLPDGHNATADASGYSCAQVWASGRRGDEPHLRAECRALADQVAVDIAVQRECDHQTERRLFVFDMDSTLIQGETIDELAKMAGVGDRVSAITASAMRGEIAFPESFRRRVGLLNGLPEHRALQVVERLPLMEGVERLFRTLKVRGAKTAILSGGFTFFGNLLQQKLGADFLHANVLDFQDGFVTGQVNSRIVDGALKAQLLTEIAASEGIPLQNAVAVGDGANDLPMLALAGMGVAFHAKPVVRAAAQFSVTHVGLDGLLYLLGVPYWEWA